MIRASFEVCLQWNDKKIKMKLSSNFHYSPGTHINEGTGKYNLSISIYILPVMCCVYSSYKELINQLLKKWGNFISVK
jgi:hypothetical protein